MYHRIVIRVVLQNFERFGQGDYESMLKGMSPSIIHTFSGQHTLGGTRHRIPAMRLWFAGFFRG
ncbi:hypothetical protein [Siphonobacter sp. BAB-5405]|uniref:hypothetical protein n=1 Tax=Siphonobacter sp. BAB-5405 TaxID=1864825 RepID=UPI0011AF09A1|nr:hypothetical protein [Siphonobacter sp. BAB-5405]